MEVGNFVAIQSDTLFVSLPLLIILVQKGIESRINAVIPAKAKTVV